MLTVLDYNKQPVVTNLFLLPWGLKEFAAEEITAFTQEFNAI
jgi:hypothetical protein